ncbi:MAG: hypothetical protein PHS96_15180 [Anaerolineales bacterium]|nr:hypothetical protein [Anaerolineales bacterium]
MKTPQTAPQNIDDYIAGFPKDIQAILEKIRMTIREAAPQYEHARGTVRFPLEQPIPYDLITQIVKFRVQENLARAAAKTKAKKEKRA